MGACPLMGNPGSATVITLASYVDPNTRMLSAMFLTPGNPESRSHKALSNKSPALQSLMARTLNTYTPSDVNIAVSNLDRALNHKWTNPFVTSNTL